MQKEKEMDVRLINEVREHETLYNIFDAKHKNVSVRNEAWEAIGEALHLPGILYFSKTIRERAPLY